MSAYSPMTQSEALMRMRKLMRQDSSRCRPAARVSNWISKLLGKRHQELMSIGCARATKN